MASVDTTILPEREGMGDDDQAPVDLTVAPVDLTVASVRDVSEDDESPDHPDDDDDDATATPTVRDEYAYLQRDGFTSEIFKIEIKNLNKKITPTMLKKFVASKNLKPKKVKVLKMTYEVKAFVSFSSEEEREAAIKELNGFQWKGCHLLAKNAAPKADPLQLKKKMDDRDAEGEPAAKRARTAVEDEVDPIVKLKNSVTPLWNVPYEEQLKRKYDDMREVIRKLGRLIDKNNGQLLRWYMKEKKLNQGMCCPLEPVLESPVREGYRNKCEFTVGRDLDGNGRVVGFRYGKYRGGCSSVGDPEHCRNVPGKMLKVAKRFQSYIETSPYDVFDPETSLGHWRMLTVRTATTGDAMAMVDFHPQDLDQTDIDSAKKSLAEHFAKNGTDDVTSLYFHINQQKTTAANDLTPYELILGEEGMTEILSGLKFRISPLAFFQVNTPGAEVLYDHVGRLCGAGPETTVLDVCCGTGTIGLTMAKRVKKVIGVEMVQSAIDDAKANASLNGVKNAEYICGKAEDVMSDLMARLGTDNVVAIVDPPRAGLHIKVVQALRRCSKLQSFVYVSCSPSSALNNFVDFCRAESKRVRGAPFIPVKALCVDLFPDTPHCELVLLFERYEGGKHLKQPAKEEAKVSDVVNYEKLKMETTEESTTSSAPTNPTVSIDPTVSLDLTCVKDSVKSEQGDHTSM